MGALILHFTRPSNCPAFVQHTPPPPPPGALSPVGRDGPGAALLAEEGLHHPALPGGQRRPWPVVGSQRKPGLTVEGVGEGFLKEVSSELGLGDDDGEVPGGEPEGPPFSCISSRPGGAGWWGWFQMVLWSLPRQILAKMTLSLLGLEESTIICPIFCDLHRVMQQVRGGART